MDTFELKREQLKLAKKIELRDGFEKVKLIAGADCYPQDNKIVASVVVCEFPSMKVIEKKVYTLYDPLPYLPGFLAYQEMPAIIEAFNMLENEPDLVLVSGSGIAHIRKIGMAAHLGLILNKPTIGITQKLAVGKIEKNRIIFENEIVGFEIRSREHANPIYISPGNLITLGSALKIATDSLFYPHKMPEPLHLARKFAKKEGKEKDKIK